jgi:hypothetical protein
LYAIFGPDRNSHTSKWGYYYFALKCQILYLQLSLNTITS